MKTLRAYSPEGFPIVGTLEVVKGRCEFSDYPTRSANGEIEFEWCGYTEIFWDEQRTVEDNGERIFLDDEANEVPESKIEWREIEVES